MKLIDMLKNVTTILVFIATLFAGYFWVNNTFAQKKDVSQTKQEVVDVLKSFKTDLNKERLEQNYLNTVNMERQYKVLIMQHPNDQNLKEELKDITKEKQDIKKKLDELRGF